MRNGVLGILGGAAGAFGAIWLGYAISDWRANAQTPPAPSDGKVGSMPQDNRRGNFSTDQKGGTVYQYYIDGQKKLEFTPQLGKELLTNLPKEGEIQVIAVGSVSDVRVGQQIKDFLDQNGYKTTIRKVMMFMPPPEHQISWDQGQEILTVAPGAK